MSRLSNFDFLKEFDKDLWKIGNRIEKQVNISPSAVKADATPFLERVLTILMERMGKKFNPRKNYYDQLDSVYREGIITRKYKVDIYDAYQLRNRIHATVDEIEKTEIPTAHQLHKKLFYIAKKLYRDFTSDYDNYKGVPDYRPIEIDTSDDEVELLEIPDFSEIIDIRYDYCVICGEPNHTNYSLCCHKCNRVMDNANNFISIRNTFGKNATFTKEDLIEYGIHEGYANQLISSLVRDNMLKVKGRYISFNNMHMDEYLSKIDKYIAVCELITKFKDDVISPAEIKQSMEYRQGSFKQDPYYQFYKLVNREIVKKFEKYLMQIEDIDKSMEYTTITGKQLHRWYLMHLNDYKKGNADETFILFNELLKNEYLNLKHHGINEKEIKKQLNVTDEVYEFWCSIYDDFEDELSKIKIDLISNALVEGKTKAEIIESAGITAKEYDDIVKVAKFKNDEFGQLHEREVEARKENFTKFLEENDLETSCELAKITVDDFYVYYDNANQSSDFFRKTTRLLMDKYLSQRRDGKTKAQAIENVGLKEVYVDRWLSRTVYHDFKDADLEVTVVLILNGLKEGKSFEEVSSDVDIDVKAIKRFIRLGQRGAEIYMPLSDYYEAEILPQKLSRFLDENEHKSMRKALETADMSEEEINHYYGLGRDGDERYVEFYETLLDEKKGTYVTYIEKGKSHKIAMRESMLTSKEYEECKDDLNTAIRKIRITLVLESIADGKTSNVAARNAGCTVDEIYEWYFRGRDGDEEYEKFYELFHKAYVRPSAVPIQEKLDSENASVENLIRSNKHLFTKKDLDIWMKNGIINVNVINLDKEEEDEDDDEPKNKNEVKKINLNVYGKRKKSRSSLGKVLDEEYDVEELKKQILKK